MNDLSELIKRSMFFDTIKDVYSYDLMDMKDIAIELGIWNSLTEEKKELYNKYSKSNVDKIKDRFDKYIENLEIIKESDDKLIYGEITKSGVDTLLKEIKKRKSITSDDVFYDIGSGNGKLPCVNKVQVEYFNNHFKVLPQMRTSFLKDGSYAKDTSKE